MSQFSGDDIAHHDTRHELTRHQTGSLDTKVVTRHQTSAHQTSDMLTMTPDMSPAARVDAATVAIPLAADTVPMATWSWFWGFEKRANQKQWFGIWKMSKTKRVICRKMEFKITVLLTPASASDPQYQSQRGGARSERAGPVSRPADCHICIIFGCLG